MHVYTIRSHSTNDCCERCGEPLYVGDQAFCDGWSVYCSESCLENERSQANDRLGGTLQELHESLYPD